MNANSYFLRFALYIQEIVTPLQLLVVMTVLPSLVRIINTHSSHQQVWLKHHMQEDFMSDQNTISNLGCIQLGLTGNSEIGVYKSLQQLQAKPYY